MAAFGLIMSAFTVQATPVLITALPFNITAPGTYLVASNLNLSSDQNGITIIVPKAGPVVLDLQGFTLSGLATRTGYSGVAINNPTGSSIAVRNGTIQAWTYGVSATACSNVHFKNITFIGQNDLCEAVFNGVSSSSVNYCAFTGSAQYAILDESTTTGNSYANNTFDGGQAVTLSVQSINAPLILPNCHFYPTP